MWEFCASQKPFSSSFTFSFSITLHEFGSIPELECDISFKLYFKHKLNPFGYPGLDKHESFFES